ncbi:MAG: DPP IV N-terminal domain-containing protein, partial [Candidatus Latescibacterota bacterium]
MVWTAPGWSQHFGKNKVAHTQLEWVYLETAHFGLYFNKGEAQLARVAATMIEDAYEQVRADIGHELRSRVPVILYRSHNDFEETNVILDLVGETTGGFTEVFKNRIVVPFEGSYKKLRHVLHHELVHAVQFDMLYGGVLESLLTRQYMFRLPLWFAEGMAEYESVGWDTEGDMIMRDAVITGYLPPLQQLQGYLVYKGGQSFLRFVAAQYGSDRLAQIMGKLKKNKDVEKSFKAILGKGLEDLSKQWQKSLRRAYWPEIAARKEPEELATRLTDHKEDGAYLNRDPAFSPYGDKIAFLSDRNDYKDIYLMSAIDGKILKRLVKGEKQGDYEEMHWLRGGITWSPDGEWIAFVAKSSGGDVLYLHQVQGRAVKEYPFDLDALFSPAWSPDGKQMALVGIKGDMSDLYVANLEDGSLERLTQDRYDESDPAWSPDGTQIAFASDRTDEPDQTPAALLAGDYDIFAIASQGAGGRNQGRENPESGIPRRIAASRWDDRSPTWSPDGKRIAFASNRNGIYNLYVAEVETDSVAALTDVLTGCFDPEWSPDGRKIAFTSFREGGWDIFVIKDPLEKRLAAMPAPTAWASESDTVEVARGSMRGTQAEQGEVQAYRARFSPDIVNAMVGYSTYAGFGGEAMISVSDVMGNHRFFFNTDLYYSFEDSDFQLAYYYLKGRIDLGVSVFHSKDYYVTQDYNWFSDRVYGGGGMASFPFSRFTRLDFHVLGMGINRQSYQGAPEKKQTRLLLPG